MVKLYEGIVSKEVFAEFSQQKGYDLYSHACNGCCIEDYLAVASILCPDIIEVDGHIFLAESFDIKVENALEKLQRLRKQFNKKEDIEKWVNSKSIGEFFFGQNSPSLDNDKILTQLCQILKYNWERRARELFPEKNIIVEVGNEIMGELGLTITMYEN